jgi:NAD+ synthase
MSELADRIAGWIASQVEGAGLEGACFGLSGGVDSAVVGALLKRALGERCLGLLMPCGSDPGDLEDARLCGEAFGIETETVALDGPYRALCAALPEATPLACANLKPRLRMATLYYYANKLSYIVAGTGNRTEIMVGYFTKHGDGGADVMPLGGLYKTEVRALARELGVPGRIIEKPPSAGLWEGQTDEEELGMTYEELDRVLAALESGATEGVDTGTLERVRRMVERSAHKRSAPTVFDVS